MKKKCKIKFFKVNLKKNKLILAQKMKKSNNTKQKH